MGAACTWPHSQGVCATNDSEAREVLAPLAVDGWTVNTADWRGSNMGGAELSREFADGEWATVGIYADDCTGQWIIGTWCGRRDGIEPEWQTIAAAAHGGEMDADEVRALVRDVVARVMVTA